MKKIIRDFSKVLMIVLSVSSVCDVFFSDRKLFAMQFSDFEKQLSEVISLLESFPNNENAIRNVKVHAYLYFYRNELLKLCIKNIEKTAKCVWKAAEKDTTKVTDFGKILAPDSDEAKLYKFNKRFFHKIDEKISTFLKNKKIDYDMPIIEWLENIIPAFASIETMELKGEKLSIDIILRKMPKDVLLKALIEYFSSAWPIIYGRVKCAKEGKCDASKIFESLNANGCYPLIKSVVEDTVVDVRPAFHGKADLLDSANLSKIFEQYKNDGNGITGEITKEAQNTFWEKFYNFYLAYIQKQYNLESIPRNQLPTALEIRKHTIEKILQYIYCNNETSFYTCEEAD
ncbi:MAG: hypothetical protein LBB25_02170 [Holosporaceae bacterium]|jgi:hypothetical protein|nr:hypothetical protein [Holosporaceae bacterium]